MRVTGCGLRVTGLPISDLGFGIDRDGLRVAGCWSLVAGCEVRVSDCGSGFQPRNEMIKGTGLAHVRSNLILFVLVLVLVLGNQNFIEDDDEVHIFNL